MRPPRLDLSSSGVTFCTRPDDRGTGARPGNRVGRAAGALSAENTLPDDSHAQSPAASSADSTAARPAIAVEQSSEMSAEQLAEARRYGRWQLGLDLADAGIDVFYLGLFTLL